MIEEAVVFETKLEDDYLVMKLSALCFAEFSRGAGLPIEPACFDRAVEFGALANIRKSVDELSTFGESFRGIEDCSYKAGQRAKYIAIHANPKMETITPDVYQEAFTFVADKVAKRHEKYPHIVPEGMLC